MEKVSLFQRNLRCTRHNDSCTERYAKLVEGKLPARVLGLVVEWAELHKKELLENWDMLQKTGKWFKIEPLD